MTAHQPSNLPTTSDVQNSGVGEDERIVLMSASPAETQRLGELLGATLRAGDIVLLEGDLGVGKTALTQGIGAGLGVRDVINSPTFTLLKEYTGRVPLYHFDLYRIEAPEEIDGLGFEDYFGGDGVAVVEWADRAGAEAPWPDDYLRLELHAAGPERRTLVGNARGVRGRELLAAFARLGTANTSVTPATPSVSAPDAEGRD